MIDLPGLVDAWHLLMPMLSSKDAGTKFGLSSCESSRNEGVIRMLVKQKWIHHPESCHGINHEKMGGLLLLYSHYIFHLDYDYDP